MYLILTRLANRMYYLGRIEEVGCVCMQRIVAVSFATRALYGLAVELAHHIRIFTTALHQT